jgi:DNA gyrase/topoisomerase IV subunit B
LADADSDGAHIATLICTLFVKHFPKLIKEGHVYVAMPPLYRIDAGKQERSPEMSSLFGSKPIATLMSCISLLANTCSESTSQVFKILPRSGKIA